jgi:hypothetical protein
MNSTFVIPPRSETLISVQRQVSDPAETILEKREGPVAKDVSNQWSPGKLENILERLLAVLSVIYFMGAAALAGVLLFKAFSP